MQVLLVRHALPVRLENTGGPADPQLSAEGHQQAEHLARYLATEKIHAVYSSPMRRAMQTAQPIAAALGLDVTPVDDLAEYDRHADNYIPVEEMKAANDPRWQQLIAGERDHGDESAEHFAGRVIGAIERLVTDHAGERIVAVCHGGVINTYLAHVIGIDVVGAGFFYPNYTSIHRVIAARTGERSIDTVNETAHLRGTGLPIGLNG